LISILSIWLLYPILRFSKNFYHWYSKGGGYHSVYWKNEELVNYISKQEFKEPILSNNPIPIILLSNKNALALPENKGISPNQSYILVLWEPSISLNYISFDIKNYEKHFRFEKIYASLNGVIYKLSPRENEQRGN
jgi:hypothetical protein